MEMKTDPWATNYSRSQAGGGAFNQGYQGYPQYPQQQYHQHQYPQVVQSSPPDPTHGLHRLRQFGIGQAILGLAAIIVGAVLLGYASENIGFPTFNFGPVVVGIIGFIAGVLAYVGAVKSLEMSSVQKCYVVANFALNVTNITLAILSAVFSYIAGAVCAGANIVFHRRSGSGLSQPIDVYQYCFPNKTELTILTFISAVLCTCLGVWCIMGTCIFCCYGRSFGFQSRRRGY